MSAKEDGEFVISLVKNFFKQDSIITKLKAFNDFKEDRIRGWETWWQVEFALYLENHKNISEWCRESPYECDGRKTNKTKLVIDFLLRKKNCKVGSYIGLELKQAWSFSKTIREMFKDIDKIDLVKPSTDDLRSFWNIGVYLEDIQYETKDLNNAEREEYLEKQAKKKGYKLEKSCVKIFDIEGTTFKVIIF